MLKKTTIGAIVLLLGLAICAQTTNDQACPIFVPHKYYHGKISLPPQVSRVIDCAWEDQDWNNSDFVKSNDDRYTETFLEGNKRSDCIRFYDFGFNIPEGASIDGVEFILEGHREGGFLITTKAQLIGPDGNALGNDRRGDVRGKDWPAGSTGEDARWYYGEYNDDWDLSLTPEIINHPNFGLELQVRKLYSSDTSIARIDRVQLIVYYSPLYTICHDSCTVFYVEDIPEAIKYHWEIPDSAFFVNKDPNGNIINLNINALDFGVHEICVATESTAGMSEPCCMDFLLSTCQTSSLGNRIWYDDNYNGIQDHGEPGMPDIRVLLFNALSHKQVDETRSNNKGYFNFHKLKEGYYYLLFDSPEELSPTWFQNGHPDFDNDVDYSNGPLTSRHFYIKSGEDVFNIDAGYYGYTSIGDYVWHDENLNGLQDSMEVGIEGVKVYLKNTNVIFDSATTDSLGYYEFGKLKAGNYTLNIQIPDSLAATHDAVSPDELNSDIDIFGNTKTITLGLGEDNRNIDAGLIKVGSICGSLWFDKNQNGIRDVDEDYLQYLQVELLDSNGQVISLRHTDSLGYYCFHDLNQSDYILRVVDRPNLILTTPNVGVDELVDSDFDTSGIFQIVQFKSGSNWIVDGGLNYNCVIEAPQIDLFNYSESCFSGQPIFISSSLIYGGLFPQGYDLIFLLIDQSSDLIISKSSIPSFDIYKEGRYGIVSFIFDANPFGLNYFDENRLVLGQSRLFDLSKELELSHLCSQIDELGEIEIEKCNYIKGNVWFDRNMDGIRGIKDIGTKNIEVQLLDSSMMVLKTFVSDTSGFYEFRDLPGGPYSISFSIDSAFDFSPMDAGADDSVDSDVNDLGSSNVLLLAGGDSIKIDAGFGYSCTLNVGGLVKVHEPKCISKTKETLEVKFDGQMNIPVNYTAYYLLVDGLTDIILDYNTSGVFEIIGAGNYSIYTIAISSQIGDYNYWDLNQIVPGQTFLSGVLQALISEEICHDYSMPANFSIISCASIGGKVWYDVDYDGLRQSDEPVQSDIVVLLKDGRGGNHAVTETDSNGCYKFERLLPDEYQVLFFISDDNKFTLQDIGTDDHIDSDVNSNGETFIFNLFAGQTESFDAGMLLDCTLDAGTLELSSHPNCLKGGTELIRVNHQIHPTTLTGFILSYILTTGTNNTIVASSVLPEFNLDAAGEYQIYPLVFNPNSSNINYLDLGQFMSGQYSIADIKSHIEDTHICADVGIPTSFRLNNCGKISGLIWLDENENGLRMPNESLMEDVVISLTDTSGNLIEEKNTSEYGRYEFENLKIGRYNLNIDIPLDMKMTLSNEGSDETIDSDFDEKGEALNLTINSGQELILDGGITNICKVQADKISQINISNQCLQDSISLSVDLGGQIGTPDHVQYIALIKDGIINSYKKGDFITIRESGNYCLRALLAVENVNDHNYINIEDFLGRDISELIDFIEVESKCADLSQPYCIEILRCASIGDRIWSDDDANGIQNMGELGLGDIPIYLLNEAHEIIDSTMSSSDSSNLGHYSFNQLVPGNYIVQFSAIVDAEYSPFKQGSNEMADSDAMPVNGETDLIHVSEGENRVDVDAGYIRMAKMGDFIWDDKNANGIQDIDEGGLNDAIIKIFDENHLELHQSFSQNHPITGEPGYYVFESLYPGNYYFKFIAPDDMVFTLPKMGGNDALDSDVDHTYGYGSTKLFRLDAGLNLSNIDVGVIDESILLAAVGDYIWLDVDNDGYQDRFEVGVNDVEINLYNESDELIASVTSGYHPITFSPGYYYFDDLIAGAYYIVANPSSDYEFANHVNGIDSDKNSDITHLKRFGSSNIFPLGASQKKNDLDIGLIKIGSIGDRLWIDENGNGVQDSSETGMNDVEVKLYNQNYELIDSTMTSNNANGEAGYYLFDNILPNGYYLNFEIPDGYIFTGSNAGSDDTKDSDVDHSNGHGSTPIINISVGEHDRDADAGIYLEGVVGSLVWDDKNANGVREINEPGVDSILVRLYDVDDELCTEIITDKNGHYLFENIPRGEYYLSFQTFGDYIFTTPHKANDMFDSDVTAANGYGTTELMSILPGNHFMNVDAGLIEMAVLSYSEIDFDVNLNDNTAQLNWSVNQWINIDYFEVERSIRGQSDFETISIIECKGRSYQLDDYIEQEGIYNYRIKAILYNASPLLSPVVSVEVLNDEDHWSLWPMPARNRLFIEGGEVMSVSLTNMLGTSPNVNLTSTPDHNLIDVSHLPEGNYIIEIRGETIFRRLITIID